MSVKNPQKTIDKTKLAPGETAAVTLSFEAEPGIISSPADMVLVLDRSNSLSGGTIFLRLQNAARDLIGTVAKASGSPDGSRIMNGSRLGLVSFSDDARKKSDLTTDTGALCAAVDSLHPAGATNHVAAFELARQMLQDSTAERRIMILFTDGFTTIGDPPDAIAEVLKDTGIEIFCIGLMPYDTELRKWASAPPETHVASTNDSMQLDRVFAEIAGRVVLAGALDFRLEEVLTPGFRILRPHVPSTGLVQITGPGTLVWVGEAAGITAPETVSLTFEVVYVGDEAGRIPVNHSLTYSDEAGSTLEFPFPMVFVNCEIILPEPCPEPVTVTAEGCRDAVRVNAAETALTGLGRIIQVNALVKNVCPGRRAAAAVILSEVDGEGNEHPRGMKTVLIPAQTGTGCRDVLLSCISFVVPEALDPSGNTDSICNDRNFRVRVLANYLDSEFMCCGGEAPAP